MQDFKKLNVWQKAYLLAVATYRATENFPKDELHGLTSQIRLSSVSIPANIAEGRRRGGRTEFNCFFQIASSSATEFEYHLL